LVAISSPTPFFYQSSFSLVEELGRHIEIIDRMRTVHSPARQKETDRKNFSPRSFSSYFFLISPHTRPVNIEFPSPFCVSPPPPSASAFFSTRLLFLSVDLYFSFALVSRRHPTGIFITANRPLDRNTGHMPNIISAHDQKPAEDRVRDHYGSPTQIWTTTLNISSSRSMFFVDREKRE
jgi:hypothetical protein